MWKSLQSLWFTVRQTIRTLPVLAARCLSAVWRPKETHYMKSNSTWTCFVQCLDIPTTHVGCSSFWHYCRKPQMMMMIAYSNVYIFPSQLALFCLRFSVVSDRRFWNSRTAPHFSNKKVEKVQFVTVVDVFFYVTQLGKRSLKHLTTMNSIRRVGRLKQGWVV